MDASETSASLEQSEKKNFSFPRKEKLKSRKLIDQLFLEGKSVKIKSVKLIFLQTDHIEDIRFQVGFTVPKKNFKSAVKRNRIKRLLREGYRLNKPHLFNNSKGNFAFLFLYLGKEMPDYHVVEQNIQAILLKFIKQTTDE
ncbi:ribonuclease P protein component [Aurantibacter sp.]|uniref:ribonuclease P protein component n=1 Tax=Aurantibacter sp. TaxID=2807103 RepID=UPI003266560B